MSVSLSTVTMAKNPRMLKAGNEFIRQHLSRQAPIEVNTLGNGFKVATQGISTNGFATVAVHSKTGSRFDTLSTEGTSSLVQRALTKGTASKSADALQKELRTIGAQFSFTNERERQAISLNCLGSDVPKAISLLSEMVTQPRLDEGSLQAARADVLEGLRESENSIPDVVFNNMYMTGYEATKLDEVSGSGMCFNPLGNAETVKSASVDQLKSFYENQFQNANNLNLVVTGEFDANAAHTAADKGFGSLPNKPLTPTDKRYTGGAARVDTGVPTAPYAQHVALAWEVCPASSPDVVPLQLVLQVFNNYDRFHNDMTSNWGIRFNMERYSTQMGNSPMEEVKTIFDTYSDTGLMGFYLAHKLGGKDDETWLQLSALQAQWCRYCQQITPYQVDVGRNLLKSKFLFENDGAENANQNIGKQLVSVGNVSPIEQNLARVEDLTTQQVSDVINHYYYDREPLLSQWGIYWVMPPYYRARRGMFQWRY